MKMLKQGKPREVSEEAINLVKQVESNLRKEIKIREIPSRHLIKVLNLLPVGQEVLFAQDWDLNTSLWIADALEIDFASLFKD